MIEDIKKKRLLLSIIIFFVVIIFVLVLFIILYRIPQAPAGTPTPTPISPTMSPSADSTPVPSTVHPTPTPSNPPTSSGTPTNSSYPTSSAGPSSSVSSGPSPIASLTVLPSGSVSLTPLPDNKEVAIIKINDAVRKKDFDVLKQAENDSVKIYDRRPTLKGVTYPNIEISLYLNSDNLSGKTKADGEGNFSFQPSKDLELGKHSVMAAISYLKNGLVEYQTSRRVQFEVVEESVLMSGVNSFNPFWTSVAILGLALLSLLNPFSEAGTYLYHLWISFLEWLGIRKKRRPWGTAYDYLNKKGIPLVVVRIIERESQRVKDAYVTDKEGAYYFNVPTGEYLIRAYKARFIFPAAAFLQSDDQEWQAGRSDSSYQDIYAGGYFKIKGEEELVNFNLPLELHEGRATLSFRRRIYEVIIKIFNKIRIPLLVVGTFFSVFTLYFFTTVLDVIIFIFYLLLWILEISRMIYLVRSGGKILAKDNDDPIEQAVVKLIKIDQSQELVLETKVTDRRGRYNFLAEPGSYRLEVFKSGFEKFDSGNFEIKKKRFLDFEIKLSRDH